MSRVLIWFSCGAASAVAAKLAVEKYPETAEILYCDTMATEHPDNQRFLEDISRWTGRQIKKLRSRRYETINDVFEARRYLSGVAGAPCTIEMKKVPREEYQSYSDTHIFGYTLEEQRRVDRFEKQNPTLHCEWILIDRQVSKYECFRRLKDANIALPAMYSLGFDHNNCLGCVKATSPAYWNKIRRHFPDVFQLRCQQSRLLGVRLIRIGKERLFLDELPVEAGAGEPDGDIECGPACQIPNNEFVD